MVTHSLNDRLSPNPTKKIRFKQKNLREPRQAVFRIRFSQQSAAGADRAAIATRTIRGRSGSNRTAIGPCSRWRKRASNKALSRCNGLGSFPNFLSEVGNRRVNFAADFEELFWRAAFQRLAVSIELGGPFLATLAQPFAIRF